MAGPTLIPSAAGLKLIGPHRTGASVPTPPIGFSIGFFDENGCLAFKKADGSIISLCTAPIGGGGEGGSGMPLPRDRRLTFLFPYGSLTGIDYTLLGDNPTATFPVLSAPDDDHGAMLLESTAASIGGTAGLRGINIYRTGRIINAQFRASLPVLADVGLLLGVSLGNTESLFSNFRVWNVGLGQWDPDGTVTDIALFMYRDVTTSFNIVSTTQNTPIVVELGIPNAANPFQTYDLIRIAGCDTPGADGDYRVVASGNKLTLIGSVFPNPPDFPRVATGTATRLNNDVNFQCVTKKSTLDFSTETDSGVAVDTKEHSFGIVVDDSSPPVVTFFIDGVAVGAHNLRADVALRFGAFVRTPLASVKQFNRGPILIEAAWP
jgi:hypothetical protein